MIIEYWYGATMLAGASFSDRLTLNNAITVMQPPSTISAACHNDSGDQPSVGTKAKPKQNEPEICVAPSTMSGVPRNNRVTTIRIANEKLPVSAISAGQLTVPAPGFSASSTPTKPAPTAIQRRRSTVSFNTIAAITVTKIGEAR